MVHTVHHVTAASSDGISIAYTVHRTRKKAPFLIFLHGMGGDYGAWKWVRGHFHKKGYSTLALDLRGHGFSQRPTTKEGYTINSYVDDLKRVVKEEKIQEHIVIGHCFGAMVALTYASTRPRTIKGLILVNAFFLPPLKSSLLASGPIRKMLLHVLPKLPMNNEAVHADFSRFMQTGDWNFIRIHSDIAHTHLKPYLFMLLTASEFNAAQFASRVRVPTLLITGRKDTINRSNQSEMLNKAIAGSQICYISDGNHLLVWNNADELTVAIEEFITRRGSSTTV